MFLPKDVKFIIDKFKENSYEAFVVGGCVRDSLLDRELNDYDITTNAMPEKTIELFDKTIPTGLQHGTVTVMISKVPYEVTTYRIDGEYKDNRRPDDVIFVSDIKEDLSRRDFTINAMAYNPYLGFKDFFNGQDDLKNKIIRAVGDADKRFNEDALRMLRAVRFATQLDFKIDENTFDAIKDNAALIKNVSYERINIELIKMLKSSSPSLGIKLLEETKLLENIFSDMYVKNFNYDYFLGNISYLDKINNFVPARLCFVLQTAFVDISEEEFKAVLRKLKLDNKTIDSAKQIFLNCNYISYNNIVCDKDLKLFLSKLDKSLSLEIFEYLIQIAEFKNIDVSHIKSLQKRTIEIFDNNEALCIKDLCINGSDLIKELNIKAGKQLGEILNNLLLKVFEDNSLNTRTQLLELAKLYL